MKRSQRNLSNDFLRIAYPVAADVQAMLAVTEGSLELPTGQRLGGDLRAGRNVAQHFATGFWPTRCRCWIACWSPSTGSCMPAITQAAGGSARYTTTLASGVKSAVARFARSDWPRQNERPTSAPIAKGDLQCPGWNGTTVWRNPVGRLFSLIGSARRFRWISSFHRPSSFQAA
jgi:hypothetical protein